MKSVKYLGKRRQAFVSEENPFLKRKGNPLLSCTNKILEKLSNHDRRIEIINQYRSLNYTYFFIRTIIQRILEDAKLVNDALSARYNVDDPDDMNIVTSEREKQLAASYDEIRYAQFLDISDFFVYANILIDQIYRLCVLFLGIRDSTRNFYKHKQRKSKRKR